VIVSENQECVVVDGETKIVVFDYENNCKAEVPKTWLEAIGMET
jgi:acyl-CoA thioesterase FadM